MNGADTPDAGRQAPGEGRRPAWWPRLRAARCGTLALAGVVMPVLLLSAACRDAEPPPLHPLKDLVEELSAAEVRRPSTRIDFGDPAARPSLVRGWSKESRKLRSGGRGSWSLGATSEIAFFVSRPTDLELVFRCGAVVPPSGSGPPRLSLAVNGAAAGEIRLRQALEEHRLTIPEALLRVGENRLQLTHPEAAERRAPARDTRVLWDFMRFGGAPVAAPPPEARGDVQRSVLWVPCDTRIDYYLELSRDSFLTARAARAHGGGGRLQVSWKPEGGSRRVLAEDFVAAAPAPLRLTDRAARGRLSLFGLTGGDACGEGAGIVLRGPGIHGVEAPSPSRPPVAATSSAAATGRSPSAAARPNVIIYLIDALRADHLSCYGYPRETSPHFDELARRGLLFHGAQAQSPWTRASVASLFTGLWPQGHATNHDDDALPAGIPTLAGRLREAGYRTAGILGNGNVSKVFGFSQGFDQYLYLAYGEKGEISARSTQIHQAVLDLLPQLARKEPFFLYVHTVDPHAPYAPPEPYRSRFAASVEDPELGSIAGLLELQKRPDVVEEATIAQLLDLYDAEIAANDASLGALVSELSRRGLFDDSLIVVLSDHGEEFFDHGDWTHGKTLHSEMLDVPLLIKLPGQSAGREIRRIVQHVDIMPTILELAGVEVPPSIHGRSLLPLLTAAGADSWGERAVAHLDLRGRALTSVIDGPWKLIQLGAPDGNAFPELYDRRADPGERSNLAPERTDLAKFLVAVRKAEEARVKTRAAESVAGEVSDEILEGLRALGYIE